VRITAQLMERHPPVDGLCRDRPGNCGRCRGIGAPTRAPGRH
jgi:hypothetical protein